MGQVIVRTPGRRELAVQYPDARPTLFLEVLMASIRGVDDTPVREVYDYCASLQPGRTPVTFGLKEGTNKLIAISRSQPRIYMALQYMIQTYLGIPNIVAVRSTR